MDTFLDGVMEWLPVTLALGAVAALMIFLYAACYVSGTVDDLEQQTEFMARSMRAEDEA